ncbi:MAG: hypothetical protein GY754_21755, partial [bacterium]|nr:hypothetical protein [bacterium]
ILMYRAYENNELYTSMMENLPEGFRFAEYKSVWSYKASPVHKRDIQIDIFARVKDKDECSLIGEVKNREETKFSKEEAVKFREKAQILMELEDIQKAALFVFSLSGFTKDAISYMKENDMAWTEDKHWIDR